MSFIKFGLMMDFNKIWIKSVQFRENGDHIVLNLAMNSENTENYHAIVLKNRLKVEKLRVVHCVIQSSTPPPLMSHLQ